MRFIRWIESFPQRHPDLPMWLLIIWFVCLRSLVRWRRKTMEKRHRFVDGLAWAAQLATLILFAAWVALTILRG